VSQVPGAAQAAAHLATRSLWRLLLAAVVMIPLAVLAGPCAQRALLPLTRVVFETVAPDLQVRRLQLADSDGGHRISVVATLARTTVIGEKVLVPDPRGEASAFTPAGQAWTAPLAAALALAAWPARRRAAWLWRLAGFVPLAALMLAADPALMLAAAIWQLMIDSVAPGTPVVVASLAAVLLGGGRIVLGLAAAAALAGLWRFPTPATRATAGRSSAPAESSSPTSSRARRRRPAAPDR
jgi:hypothetical protein